MSFTFTSEKGNIIAANQPIPMELANYGGRKYPESYKWATSEGRTLRYKFGMGLNAHWFDARGNHLRPATSEEWVFAHSWGQSVQISDLNLPKLEVKKSNKTPNIKVMGKWYHAYSIPGSGVRYQLGRVDALPYIADYGTAFVEIDESEPQHQAMAIHSPNGIVDMG